MFSLLKSTPHLKRFATLPCEIISSAFVYQNSWGIAATRWRIDRIILSHI